MGTIRNFFNGRRASATSPPPSLLSIRSSKLFIIATICIAVFTDIFLYGVIVPVIPFALASRVGVDENDVQQWVSVLLAAYGGALLVGSPLAGWYADKSTSRRLPLLLGLLALAGATVMLCLARTIGLLVAGRILQGLSAAVVWTVGLALLVDTVGQKDIGQVSGYVSISMSLGILSAPLLGGVVYARAGYYAVYYMAFGLVILDILLRLVLIEKKIAAQWALESAANDTSTTNEKSREEGIDRNKVPQNIPGEARGPEDTDSVPGKRSSVYLLLTSRRLLAACWGCIVQGALMTALDSVVPLFVQQTFAWDSTAAGLVFLALIIPGFSAPLVGAMSDRYGPRWLTVIGFLFAIPFWVLLRLVSQDTINQKVLLMALLTLIGVALALVMPPLMAEITYVVEAKERKNPGVFGATGAYAQAYGLFTAAFAAGTLIGPLWAGYIRTEAGWSTMAWTLGLFSAAGAFPAMIWTGGLITRKNAKSGAERALGHAVSSDTTADESGNAV